MQGKHFQSGRSMVEMLGVLAVMGVLSVAGIAGYNSAMNRHRANELMYEASKRAAMAQAQLAMGRAPENINFSEFGNAPVAGATFDVEALPIGTSTTTFGVKVSGVAEGVCKQLANMSGGKARVRKQDALASELTAASCDDSNALAFVFGDDELTNSESGVDSNSTSSGSSLDSGSDSGSCSGLGSCSGSGSERCDIIGTDKCENGTYYYCDYSGLWIKDPNTPCAYDGSGSYDSGSDSSSCSGSGSGSGCDVSFSACTTNGDCGTTCPNKTTGENCEKHICELNENLSTGCVCPEYRDTINGKCSNCLNGEAAWIQPKLTSNSSYGSLSQNHEICHWAYQAFDGKFGDSSNNYDPKYFSWDKTGGYIDWNFPVYLKISECKLYQTKESGHLGRFPSYIKLYGIVNTQEIELCSINVSSTPSWGSYVTLENCDKGNAYNRYKWKFGPPKISSENGVAIDEIEITATTRYNYTLNSDTLMCE